MQDINPNAVPADITIVFQQGTEAPCNLLIPKANSNPPQWSCFVRLPETGLKAATADPSGIAVWTNQQTRSKMANYAFTYLPAEIPTYSWHYPEVGMILDSFTSVAFDNYCVEVSSWFSYPLSLTHCHHTSQTTHQQQYQRHLKLQSRQYWQTSTGLYETKPLHNLSRLAVQL